MAVLKTQKNSAPAEAFLNAVKDEGKRKDSMTLLSLFKKLTKQKPAMWGDSIVGFGSFHYKSERSRQEGDWFMTGFSPRKQNLTVYIIPGFSRYEKLMKKLGKFKTGGSCLYINKLADVDLAVLGELVSEAFSDMKKKYEPTSIKNKKS